jgi:N-hydroxyarylamine O-acetyltransferase
MTPVASYLDRIGHDAPVTASVETLVRLHRAHLLSVPFENFDIHLGVPIVLSVPAFLEKIVTRRRGGFCYELNGLFAWLLTELGFKVALHSARVASAGRFSPEFDHLVLSVKLEDRWVADVGFGESSLDPLRLGAKGDSGASAYSIAESSGLWTMARRIGGILEPQYSFALVPRRLDEFEARCVFQQTSPESHFTKKPICSLPTPSGRISLSGRKLIVTSGGRRGERELESSEEYRTVLRDEFGIEMAERDVDRLIRSE